MEEGAGEESVVFFETFGRLTKPPASLPRFPLSEDALDGAVEEEDDPTLAWDRAAQGTRPELPVFALPRRSSVRTLLLRVVGLGTAARAARLALALSVIFAGLALRAVGSHAPAMADLAQMSDGSGPVENTPRAPSFARVPVVHLAPRADGPALPASSDAVLARAVESAAESPAQAAVDAAAAKRSSESASSASGRSSEIVGVAPPAPPAQKAAPAKTVDFKHRLALPAPQPQARLAGANGQTRRSARL